MQLKKFIMVVFSIVLLSFIGNAFAASCPPISQIRTIIFKYAVGENSEWRLYSDPFKYDGKTWNVRFDVKLLDAKDPTTAVNVGQKYFDHSPLPQQGRYRSFPHFIECDYESDYGYDLYAFSPARY